MEEHVIYEEKAPHSKALNAFLTLTLLILILALVFTGVKEDKTGFKIVAVVSVIVAYAYWSFLNMRFRITAEGVEALMPPFSYKASFPEILDVQVSAAPWYMGWGLRLWWRRVAFVSRHRPVVVIKKKTGLFKTFIISPADAEGFAARIREQGSL